MLWLLGVVIVLAAYWNQIVAKINEWKYGRLLKAALLAGGTAVFIGDIWGVCGGDWGWLFCSI